MPRSSQVIATLVDTVRAGESHSAVYGGPPLDGRQVASVPETTSEIPKPVVNVAAVPLERFRQGRGCESADTPTAASSRWERVVVIAGSASSAGQRTPSTIGMANPMPTADSHRRFLAAVAMPHVRGNEP